MIGLYIVLAYAIGVWVTAFLLGMVSVGDLDDSDWVVAVMWPFFVPVTAIVWGWESCKRMCVKMPKLGWMSTVIDYLKLLFMPHIAGKKVRAWWGK